MIGIGKTTCPRGESNLALHNAMTDPEFWGALILAMGFSALFV